MKTQELNRTEVGATTLVDVAPSIVRFIRARMREQMPTLSMAQFRALAFLDHHRGCSLTEVADHLGVTLPTASVLIDRLVWQEFVSRTQDTTSRRRVTLALTRHGGSRLAAAREVARRQLAELLATVPEATLGGLIRGLETLAQLPALQGRGVDR